MPKRITLNIVAGIAFAFLAGAPCLARERFGEREVQVFTELTDRKGRAAERRIDVGVASPVWSSGPDESRFKILLFNSLDEEIFIAVEPAFEEVGFTVQKGPGVDSVTVDAGPASLMWTFSSRVAAAYRCRNASTNSRRAGAVINVFMGYLLFFPPEVAPGGNRNYEATRSIR